MFHVANVNQMFRGKKLHRGFNSQCEKEEGVIIMFRKRVVNPGIRFCREMA